MTAIETLHAQQITIGMLIAACLLLSMIIAFLLRKLIVQHNRIMAHFKIEETSLLDDLHVSAEVRAKLNALGSRATPGRREAMRP